MGDALATLARDEHYDDVAALIRDPVHGDYRTYLLWALGYMKRPEAVDLALEMLDDDELEMPALYARSDLRAERAEPTLRRIAAEPRPPRGTEDDAAERAQVRIAVARKALAKLEKARASGHARG